jgi:hypothetical protein
MACSERKTTKAMGEAPSAPPPGERPFWRDALAPYVRPRWGRSLLDLATSVVPYLALSVLMYLAVDVSYLLVLAVAVPASGFLLRTYIVFHDCAHGSFLPAKRVNLWLAFSWGCLSIRRSTAGGTVTPSTTPPPVTWIGAGSGTSSR